MVDWKKYRESIGYTQAKMSKDAKAWYALALGYHRAAELLNDFPDRIPSDTRPFAFNSALSIPDWNNYFKIWNLCAAEYASAYKAS
jgi:hypothetical protein